VLGDFDSQAIRIACYCFESRLVNSVLVKEVSSIGLRCFLGGVGHGGGGAALGGAASSIAVSQPSSLMSSSQEEAINRGMATLMDCYEAELKNPIRNILAGDLLRSVLIQVI